MKKLLTVAGYVLAAVLAFGGPALAATTTDYVRDYGTGAGQIAPQYGSVGLMSTNYVRVRDSNDDGGNRFYDAFVFDTSGTIDSLMLTLHISGARDNLGQFNLGEAWSVYGSTNGGTSANDRLQLGSILSNGSSWVVTLLAGSGAVFDQAIASGIFGYWFGDSGYLSNSFQLDKAILSVTATVVPLPAGVLLLGSALGALGLFGWRKRRSAGAPAAA